MPASVQAPTPAQIGAGKGEGVMWPSNTALYWSYTADEDSEQCGGEDSAVTFHKKHL